VGDVEGRSPKIFMHLVPRSPHCEDFQSWLMQHQHFGTCLSDGESTFGRILQQKSLCNQDEIQKSDI
jgi:hypothetical protein